MENQRRIAQTTVWLTVLLVVAAIASSSADWPRFRGPTGDGVVTGSDAPFLWGPQENVVWKTELPGPGSSSPIISGQVFLRSDRHLYCIGRR